MIKESYEQEQSNKRIANVISVLIPAKSYLLHCSWTKDKALPAIEDFACRLLLLFGELSASELQSYFGLASREREVLINTLLDNRLISINDKGLLIPTPLLSSKKQGDNGPTTLTEYEERSETAIFDLLTMGLMPRKALDNSRFGLPELLPKEGTNLALDDVITSFSRQYRAHLEYTRTNEREIKSSRLYKVSSCEPDKTIQIPVDMDISLQANGDNEPLMFRNAMETSGNIRRRALSNELESCVADYFAELEVPKHGKNFEEFCHLVDDPILMRYTTKDKFNFSMWLNDRDNRKTGYGSQSTTAVLGPIYLKENWLKLSSIIRESRKNWNSNEKRQAIWLSSAVPLWGANGESLAEFTKKIEHELAENHSEKGTVTALFNINDKNEGWLLKNKFSNRIPNGCALYGQELFDRMELFIIPGVLAVCQFHTQPCSSSGVTVPIGYLTVDVDRMNLLYNHLVSKFKRADSQKVIWSQANKLEKDLYGDELSAIIDKEFIKSDKITQNNKKKNVPIIKIKRKKNFSSLQGNLFD